MNANLFTGNLVRLTAEDPQTQAEAYSRWMQDTECWRLQDSYPPRSFSSRQIKEWIEKDFEKDLISVVPFTVRTLADDRMIGDVGLFDIHWTHGDAFVGIGIQERELWGKGYGTDAMQVMLRYAFTELNLHRISLFVFSYNPRAIRSYEKSGFVVEGRVRGAMNREGQRHDFIYMGILREEWLKL